MQAICDKGNLSTLESLQDEETAEHIGLREVSAILDWEEDPPLKHLKRSKEQNYSFHSQNIIKFKADHFSFRLSTGREKQDSTKVVFLPFLFLHEDREEADSIDCLAYKSEILIFSNTVQY